MQGKFDSILELPASGKLRIKGPIKAKDDKISGAQVMFLIVQGKGLNAVTVEGMGAWDGTVNDDGEGEWTGDVDRTGLLPRDPNRPDAPRTAGDLKEGTARGIAFAIAADEGEIVPNDDPTPDTPWRFDPPSIQAVTWCAHFKFVAPGSSPTQGAES